MPPSLRRVKAPSVVTNSCGIYYSRCLAPLAKLQTAFDHGTKVSVLIQAPRYIGFRFVNPEIEGAPLNVFLKIVSNGTPGSSISAIISWI